MALLFQYQEERRKFILNQFNFFYLLFAVFGVYHVISNNVIIGNIYICTIIILLRVEMVLIKIQERIEEIEINKE